VYIARGVLIQRHRLKQNEVLALRLLHVYQLEQLVAPLEYVGVGLLANLALKLLPVVARDILPILLGVTLGLNPVLQALEVDQTDRAATLACQNQRVLV
jgi:hypothetical protein